MSGTCSLSDCHGIALQHCDQAYKTLGSISWVKLSYMPQLLGALEAVILLRAHSPLPKLPSQIMHCFVLWKGTGEGFKIQSWESRQIRKRSYLMGQGAQWETFPLLRKFWLAHLELLYLSLSLLCGWSPSSVWLLEVRMSQQQHQCHLKAFWQSRNLDDHRSGEAELQSDQIPRRAGCKRKTDKRSLWDPQTRLSPLRLHHSLIMSH